MVKEHYEVIIVGAGPAGVSAALTLNRNGVNCCLIDRSNFPRQKNCGGLLTRKTVDLLEDMGFIDLNTVIESTLDRLCITDGDNVVVDLEIDYDFNLVDRFKFDNWLLQKYIGEGGKVKLGENVVSINLDDKILSTSKGDYSFDYVIGADGVKGVTAKYVKREPIECDFGIKVEVPTASLDADPSVVELDMTKFKDGYYWRFPKGAMTTVGFHFTYDKNVDYIELAKKVLPKNAKFEGAFLPHSKNITSVVDDRGLLLVGDAAGFIDNLTGEGIYFALESGILAAESILCTNPVEMYKDVSKTIIKNVYKSWKLINAFYKFRKPILKLAKKHQDFVKYVCDSQVSTQKCDYSLFKLIRVHKRVKVK